MESVHFPEEQLIAYLRVFLPEGRLPAVLDEIARAAIKAEITDEMDVFAIAHGLMEPDDRRTADLEAAVLVAEVGLSLEAVAGILDLAVEEVQAAVDGAWAEAAGASAPTPATARRRRMPGGWVFGGVAVLVLIALAVAVFSEAGIARLNAVGLDPVVAFFVVLGLVGGGSALIRAGSTLAADRAMPPIGIPSLGSSAQAVDPVPGRAAGAADASDAPAAPSQP